MSMDLFSCFFFKQKTAYEMRISDWSSDVCSSDLRDGVVIAGRQAPVELGIVAEPARQHMDMVMQHRLGSAGAVGLHDVDTIGFHGILDRAGDAPGGAGHCGDAVVVDLVDIGGMEIGRAHV